MGGNALSVKTLRLGKAPYEQVARWCSERLREAYPANRVAPIEAYRQKADFGDLDILVESTGFDPLRAAAALGATEIVRNGPVTSLGVAVPKAGGDGSDTHAQDAPDAPDEGGIFQVDLITIDAPSFDYAFQYFRLNDAGNLFGRIAHKMGLAHRHDGLYYYCRDGDYKFREIELTKDYERALKYLGYDPKPFMKGFDTLGELFEYISTSTFFNTEIYLLENRNHRARVRDRKRKTYMEFLGWCDTRRDGGALDAYAYPDDKAAWNERINEHFPHFKAALEAAHRDLAEHRAVKERFNGAFVRELTGMQDKELGVLMKHIKDSFDSPEAMREFMAAASEEAITARVMEVAERMNAQRASSPSIRGSRP
jgi:hypothetical protein